MEAGLFPNLGQRNGAQQRPEISRLSELKLAVLSAAEEGPASRLHQVFGPETPPQAGRQVLFCQALQPLAVLNTEFLDHRRIIVPEASNHPLPLFFFGSHLLIPAYLSICSPYPATRSS